MNIYLEQELAKVHPMTQFWNRTVGDEDLVRWESTNMGLGSVINLIFLDNLLSGEHLDYMIDQLEKGRYVVPLNFSQGDPVKFVNDVVLPFLRNREAWQNRRVATNSEYVIDWFQQHAGNESVAKALIKESQQVLTYLRNPGDTTRYSIPVFPTVWTMGKNRIPGSRLKAGDYILVDTKLCAGLKPLHTQIKDIKEAGRRKEWTLIRPIPEAVDRLYPSTEFTQKAVKDLRAIWQRLRNETKDAGHKNWYNIAANGQVVEQIIKPGDKDFKADAPANIPQVRKVPIVGLKHHYTTMQGVDKKPINTPLKVRRSLAVEWYRQVYAINLLEPFLNKDGTTQSVGDGAPDYILHDLLAVFQEAGLTGQVVYVNLDPRAKRRLLKNGEMVKVEVLVGKDHIWVMDPDNGLKLGTIPSFETIQDGSYHMSPEGVIVVREANPVLHSNFKMDQIAKRAFGDVDEVGADYRSDDDPYAY